MLRLSFDAYGHLLNIVIIGCTRLLVMTRVVFLPSMVCSLWSQWSARPLLTTKLCWWNARIPLRGLLLLRVSMEMDGGWCDEWPASCDRYSITEGSHYINQLPVLDTAYTTSCSILQTPLFIWSSQFSELEGEHSVECKTSAANTARSLKWTWYPIHSIWRQQCSQSYSLQLSLLLLHTQFIRHN